MEFFQNFHAEAIFENCLNGFFLALILKKVDAMDARDFRPIILVWGGGGVEFTKSFLMFWLIGLKGSCIELFWNRRMPLS